MLFSKARASSAVNTGVLPVLTMCFRATDGGSRVGRDHLPDNKPVKELAQAGQILLDRGRRIRPGQRLDVAGHVQGLDR